MLISLIVPTYGRTCELEGLLESLNCQTYKKFEVLIIDQNDIINIDPIINNYSISLNIKHIKSSRKGTGFNKNIGIKYSKGTLISFPDDDCKYYPETLQNVYDYSQKNAEIDLFYGRIYDKQQKTNIIRNWATFDIRLNKLNFHNNHAAITSFCRNKSLLFDEHFGVGTINGCGDEFDYVMQALNLGMNVMYTPEVSMWHPRQDVNVMSDEKVYSYARGYGAVFRKNLNFSYGFLFVGSLCYQILLLIISFCKADLDKCNKRLIAFKGRIIGFFTFNSKPNQA